MLQTYKKAEEYIARSKTGAFRLLPYTSVLQKSPNLIEFGCVDIHTDNTMRLNANWTNSECLTYIGVNAIPFTQKLKQTMIGVLPLKHEPKFMTIHDGKIHPITENSVFKYGVLQNPEPLMTISKESYKQVSKEVREELEVATGIGMLVSEDELRKTPDENIAYNIGHSVRIDGRSLADVKNELRADMMHSKLSKLPFTETINYEV